MTRWTSTLTVLLMLLGTTQQAVAARGSEHCGDTGVWVQILGAGGPELTDGQGAASYLVWIDDRARLLVDPAPASSLRFDESGASYGDLDAILLTHLHADHVGDFPAYVKGAYFESRDRPLPVYGPDGAEPYPATTEFVQRLIGERGAFAYLANYLSRDENGFKITATDVSAKGQRRWSKFRNETFSLAAVPVNHGPVPALAWRIDVGEQSIVFTGDFNNAKNTVTRFARGVDALVIHHAVPENARGNARALHVVPSQIGQIAAATEARMVILGHRMSRTRGRESASRAAIEAHYDGSLIFANDLECWGL